MRRMTLIGMPGSGKSSVGKIIASRLGWSFIDTDSCIEERHGIALQALIDRGGDSSFRRLEEKTILDLVIAERTVIATGGSVVYSAAAMEWLTSISAIVFLDAPLEAIRTHIESQAPRGIIGMPQGGLEELCRERVPRYRSYAGIIVRFTDQTPEEVATRVLSQLRIGR